MKGSARASISFTKKEKPNVDHFDSRLAHVYSTRENKEQHYDNWAGSYETDLVDDMGYVAHKDASDVFASVVTDKSLKILDVACGTGLVGEYLQELGYRNIDGVDFSKEMLAISEKRGVYQKVWQQDFTIAADLKQLYDALICVGLFSFNIPEIQHMHHVVNCVEPGGYCVITVNGAAWEQLDLEPDVHREAEQHGFTVERIEQAGYIENEGIDSRVLVIRR